MENSYGTICKHLIVYHSGISESLLSKWKKHNAKQDHLENRSDRIECIDLNPGPTYHHKIIDNFADMYW